MAWMWGVLWWVLTLAGVGLLAWSLWWDRAGWRGRAGLRCGGCWYDLTGAGEDEPGRPMGSRSRGDVRCPECGKGHGSLRSMRKTRRRWWGLVGAGVLLVLAHGAVSVPAVKARGWMALAPSAGMVGLMASGVPSPDSWNGAMLGELRARTSGAGHPSSLDGWLSRRLVFVMARILPARLVTDQGTVRGRMFRPFVEGTLRGDSAFAFERRWAESVVWVGAERPAAAAPGSPLWAEVRARRLVGGRYRVEIGEGPDAVWFEAFARDLGVLGPNPGPGMTPAQQREAERGDQIVAMGAGLFGVRGERGMHAVVARFDDAASAVGRAMVERPVRVLARAGPVGGDGPWELETEPGLRLSYTVASDAGPERVVGAEADALGRVIEETLRVEAYWVVAQKDGERTFAIDVMVIDLPALTRPVTIGGRMEVGAWRAVAGERVWVGLGSAGPGWFRVMPAPEGTDEGDWIVMGDELLLPWPQVVMMTVRWFGGGDVVPDFAGAEPVVLRVGLGGRDEAWADLSDGGGSERVLDAEVEIDTGMTVGEVVRYRAMP